MFRLLLDQGDIINTVVYAGDNKLSAELRSIADSYKANNVVVSQKEDQFDEYLTACDVDSDNSVVTVGEQRYRSSRKSNDA